MKKHEQLIFAVIILIAAFFRIYQLNLYPPGLDIDEAMNGTNAIQALETGDFKVFYPENNGREGLFINIQALSIWLLGNTALALRIVSAIIGTLTVAGLYLFARKLFTWQIAAFSSFFMAVSFWHVNFSRLGFRAILAPFFLVWGLYFFWKGLTSGKLAPFFWSGIAWGLGFYTYISFRAMPLALGASLIGYWYAIRKDYFHEKYRHALHRIGLGVCIFLATAAIVIAPLFYHFFTHPEDVFGRTSKISVFSDPHPFQRLLVTTGQTFGMFTFAGDYNWRHNFSGEPMLFWPVGALFAVGFLRSFLKLFRTYKSHGHLSPVHLLLLSWFFAGLLPVIASTEGLPHALLAIIVSPVAFIFAGEGLWWLAENMERWYHARDYHDLTAHLPFHHSFVSRESIFAVTTIIILFLISVGAMEFNKYFMRWGPNPDVAEEFMQSSTDTAHILNQLPIAVPKYAVIGDSDVLVDGISTKAQPIMYLTDTGTQAKQDAKNLHYITLEQYKKGQFEPSAVIIFADTKK